VGAGTNEEQLMQAAKSAKFNRQGLAGQVADELRRRILAGEIGEGTQLMQEQLAAEFGISKVPVREALFQLEAEGFVTQQYHRGAVVSSVSPAQVLEIFEVRTQIEVWLLDLAMRRATDEDVAAARALSDEFGEMIDPIQAWDLNWRFHEALYRPAGKPYAVDHLRKVHSQTARYLRLQYDAALAKTEIVREHNQLLELYAARDPGAITLLREHIMGAATKLAERLEEINAEGKN
jgi:DNA-binding GntR family transcriptional regulator